MCLAAESVLNRGSLSIAQVRVDVTPGPDGRFYTKYPLMCVLQCVPALWLRDLAHAIAPRDGALERLALTLVPHALTATLALGCLQLARAFGASPVHGIWFALAVVFTTPLLISGRLLYSESLQAVLIVYATLTAVRARDATRRSAFVWCGVVCGIALNTKVLLAILPIAFMLDQSREALSRERLKSLTFALPGALGGAAVFLAYNQLRYGNPVAQGYDTERDGTLGFSVGLGSGLYGLLLSSGKSVFAYAPILIASAAALPRFWRERRRNLWLVGIPSLFVLCVSARWWAWNGDWAWGPRLIIAIIPLLAVPALGLLQQASRVRGAALAVLAAGGLYIQALAVCVDPGRFLDIAHTTSRGLIGRGPSAKLRDDLLAVHFVPELSPILGQHWLVWRYVSQPGWHADSDYPWRGLGVASWRPRSDPTPKQLDFWVDATSSRAAWSLQAALLAATALCGAGLWRRLRSRPFEA